ncbi:amidohydrolase family protein [Reichenbachiella agarivorans]|uniref:Amidohydrolase family protein n=1 Tax=Reichenbachiella agarivorans TaxID=2979464 RepID=A0ABY6CQJ3_9BACT|nr:amidohydrolase family protein [Reichenbachiella agarivorans]UXP32629.1 amidohydrolase family protein [Reichenbachiella agarivorans]
MRLDAHQHFWQFDPQRDAWITEEMSVIRRDFMPADLQPLLETRGIDGCVAVQADQSLTETDFLLGLAQQHDCIKAVVGWVDLRSDNLSTDLQRYVANPYFKGVRHILQAETAGYMTEDQFVQGVKKLKDHNLTYDILITESQLDEATQLIQLLPEMPLVIDHIAKPNIQQASFAEWAKQMEKISRFDHVAVKLSGMVTEAGWQSWDRDDFAPYLDFCMEHFGAKRLMYGSDWPVCLLAADYGQVHDLLADYIASLSVFEQDQIMGKTAADFYSIKV